MAVADRVEDDPNAATEGSGVRNLWDIDNGEPLPPGAVGVPAVCSIINANACGPVLTLTLTWDGPTSDVDLHIYEPGEDGTHVYYGSPQGRDGYLDVDDRDGLGPEHYIIIDGVKSGENYVTQVHMFSLNSDETVNWILEARSYGEHLWTIKGVLDFSNPYSDMIPFQVEDLGGCSCEEGEVRALVQHTSTGEDNPMFDYTPRHLADHCAYENFNSKYDWLYCFEYSSDLPAWATSILNGRKCDLPYPFTNSCYNGFINYWRIYQCYDHFHPFEKGEYPMPICDEKSWICDGKTSDDVYRERISDEYKLLMIILHGSRDELLGLANLMFQKAVDQVDLSENCFTS